VAPSIDVTPPAEEKKKKKPSAAELPRWCILPIGDSLTQGVGSHGSYRESLAAALVTQTRGVSRVGFAGTRTRPCIAKKPDAVFNDATAEEKSSPELQSNFGPSDLRHEGHCNWDSASLLRHWRSLVANGTSGGGGGGAPATAPTNATTTMGAATTTRCGPLEYHTALLMVGHNDAFRIARMCKVREGCSATTWAPARAVREAVEASIDVPDTLPQNLRCALANVKRGFQKNLEQLLASLLDNAAGPPPSRVAKFQGAQDPPRIVLGVNPPTGFPCIDVMLRRAIGQAVLELRNGANGTATRASVAKRDLDRIAVAHFSGFERGVHTFDSTHPNAKGGALLGQHWADALTNGGDDQDPFSALASTGSA
jgi:hypothetical protein